MLMLTAVFFFLGLAVSSCSGGPHILSTYMSMTGVSGGLRDTPHTGVDFWGRHGSPALAAADGAVVTIYDNWGCGIGVFLAHKNFGRFTLYYHLANSIVQVGQSVRRGEVVGLVGTTGQSSGVPHVHLVLTTLPGAPAGDLEGTEDPLGISVGCFDPTKTYPADRLVLTYPVRC